ncbi:helix-turn-helix transcriptional regulator [Kineococcus sp. GCM10028916]|uniref:helix-turn-helix transcriptional regulator n=1 Tax=Kineococcus sp. GCM10028916 TaxID=3273394 RepID=UPI003626441A
MDDLGAALRDWRDRLDPADAGLTRNGRRRAPGLRREELAVLAGISIDYVVRLEQGRASTPSAQVCGALARALQLADEESAHLLRLAGHAADPGRVPRLIPASVRRIGERLAGHPLAVYDATWCLLHWNPLFAATFGDPTGEREGTSLLLRHFTDGLPRIRFTPAQREAFEESLVSDLRSTTSRYPRDPDVASLVAELLTGPRFAELWDRRTVAGHESAHKVVEHPEIGDVELDSDTLTTQGSNLRVVVYTPRPGSDAAGKLELLAALGTQRMAPRV